MEARKEAQDLGRDHLVRDAWSVICAADDGMVWRKELICCFLGLLESVTDTTRQDRMAERHTYDVSNGSLNRVWRELVCRLLKCILAPALKEGRGVERSNFSHGDDVHRRRVRLCDG